jgi:transcriptional regulator with XRE-family HTH domain
MGTIANRKLKTWRTAHGLTMEQAAARIVVDGKTSDKATWHGWESKGKIPKPPFMSAVVGLVEALEPNDFYRLDGGATEPPAQHALAL